MSKKILIVDDSMFIRGILKDMLSNDYDVIEAEDGKSAIAQYNTGNPDLVLLDIIMPEGMLEGLNVLQQIRQKNPKAKVIMITAVGQESVIDECKKNGATDYIIKPFDEEDVMDKTSKYLAEA